MSWVSTRGKGKLECKLQTRTVRAGALFLNFHGDSCVAGQKFTRVRDILHTRDNLCRFAALDVYYFAFLTAFANEPCKGAFFPFSMSRISRRWAKTTRASSAIY